jgi:hypothetical protein
MPLRDKEKQKEYMKGYYQANKEKIKAEKKQYMKNFSNTVEGKKTLIIRNWKNWGVKYPDFDLLYETYINTNNCNVCKKEFKISKDRCLDHDHESGLFRQILCHSCNTHDSWKKKM